jgi:hypothetical protein
VPPAVVRGLRLRVDGVVRLNALDVTANGERLELSSRLSLVAGQRVSIEMLPSAAPGLDNRASALEREQRQHVFVDTVIAAAVEDLDAAGGPEVSGSFAAAQVVSVLPAVARGAVAFSGDRDFYRIELAAGGTLRAEVVAGRVESPLRARLSLWRADGSQLLAAADGAPPPGESDPVLPPYSVAGAGAEALVLVVENLDAAGSAQHRYALHLEVLP